MGKKDDDFIFMFDVYLFIANIYIYKKIKYIKNFFFPFLFLSLCSTYTTQIIQ